MKTSTLEDRETTAAVTPSPERTLALKTADDLQQAVLATGTYDTPPERLRHPMPNIAATHLFRLCLVWVFARGYYSARRPDFEHKEWGVFCFRMLRLTEFLGGVVTFSGFEHVRQARFPVVWVANHASPLETYLLPLLLTSYSRLMIVLKEILAHYPLFGRVVRAVDPIRVQRKSAIEDLRKVLTHGFEGLRAGRSVLIFPQGQRLPLFDPSTFNTMGVKLAQRAHVPLVPIAVRTDFLRAGRLHKDLISVRPRRPVRIACGPVIAADTPPADMHQAAIDFITGKLGTWERETGDPLLQPQT